MASKTIRLNLVKEPRYSNLTRCQNCNCFYGTNRTAAWRRLSPAGDRDMSYPVCSDPCEQAFGCLVQELGGC